MSFAQLYTTMGQLTEALSFAIAIFILLGAVILTIKARFIQFRAIPKMFRLLFASKKQKNIKGEESISSRKALFTAMSTSIGIGNIAIPVIAIKIGGPGALLGFVLAALFGGASTFTEVTSALKNRIFNTDGTISGGPMQYIKKILGPYMAMFYAIAGFLVLVIWSANQSNQLADLLQARGLPTYVTGIILSITITYILMGGIKRIGDFSAKIVPFMFFLYVGATGWIILLNIAKLPEVLDLIITSAFTTKAIVGASVGYGLQSTLRWGLAKGFFANEAGLGTSTIPHSMSTTKSPTDQGILSMVAVYSNGLLSLLSGLTVLLTGTWLSDGLGMGINIIAQSFTLYFSSLGITILMLSTLLFAFGTVVGNSYNGSQCFLYATRNRGLKYYYLLIAAVVFLGAISDVTLLTKVTDIFLVPIAIPNIIAIIMIAFKNKDLFNIDNK